MSTLRSLAARRALLDTSAYFALADLNEQRHPDADTVHNRLVTERWRLFTTNFIVAETHALMLNRLGYRYAMRFLAQLDDSLTTIVRVAAIDERRAREILRQYDDKNFSLTDATGFAVMERLRIPYDFTFDRNFAQYGLNILSTG